jgi:hypothetical protein
MPLALPDIIPAQLEGLRSLIRGEVKTGKTILLSRLVSQFLAEGFDGLAVMDFAPETTRGVGGKMPLPSQVGELRVFSPSILPPRLSGGSPAEVEKLAQVNGSAIDKVLSDYQKSPGKVLFVNDVSLYLQSREPELLLDALASTPTLVMNGYHGVSLGRDDFSQRERARMERLAASCDLVIDLPVKRQ